MFNRVLTILLAVWRILVAVWRAYVRRVRAAEGSRKMAWIIVPIFGLIMLFGMLTPTAPAAPTSARQKSPPTRTSAPTRTPRPPRNTPTTAPDVEQPAAIEPTATIEVPAEQPTEAPVVDEPVAAPAVSGPVAPTGDECPPEAMIKGNQGTSGWIYHRPGGSSYRRTDPEQCFATSADAEAAGYRAAKR